MSPRLDAPELILLLQDRGVDAGVDPIGDNIERGWSFAREEPRRTTPGDRQNTERCVESRMGLSGPRGLNPGRSGDQRLCQP